ncbi:hypothetical protein MFRU_054g00070 [Monilinia fructicola]|nr:hypothetical protein MFRU_054g00070 [Monilinia fructicola]
MAGIERRLQIVEAVDKKPQIDVTSVVCDACIWAYSAIMTSVTVFRTVPMIYSFFYILWVEIFQKSMFTSAILESKFVLYHLIRALRWGREMTLSLLVGNHNFSAGLVGEFGELILFSLNRPRCYNDTIPRGNSTHILSSR